MACTKEIIRLGWMLWNCNVLQVLRWAYNVGS